MTVPVLFLSHATPNLACSQGFAAQSLTRLGGCFPDASQKLDRGHESVGAVPITGVVVVSSRWTSARLSCVSSSVQHTPIDDEDALATAALEGLREALAKHPQPYRGEERRRPDRLRDARGSGWGRRASDHGGEPQRRAYQEATQELDPETLRGERMAPSVGRAQAEPIRVYAPPGDTHLAQSAADLLDRAGFGGRLDPMRGLDHGVWAPLTHLFAHACVPLAQVSIPEHADVQSAFNLGRALAPLRERGVLLVGSGQYPRVPAEEIGNVMESALADSFAWPTAPQTEALRDGFGAMGLPQLAWRAWIMEQLLGEQPRRALSWTSLAPEDVHPDEEHAARLRPLWVMMGAAHEERTVPLWMDAGVFEGCFVDAVAWGLPSDTRKVLSDWRRAQAQAWMHEKR